MLVEQINAVGPQALQRAFHSRADTLRRAVHRSAAINIKAEFGRDNHLVADRLQSLADNLFVFVGTIDFGCVEEGNAALESAADQGDRVRQR